MDSIAEEGRFAPAEAIKGKEPLTQKELENLIASFGNSEAKAVTLLAMKPEVIYTDWELMQAVWSAQGDNPGWLIRTDNYCPRSFEPIGLVAVKVEDNLQKVGWVKTKYGTENGDPLAGLLLDYSLKTPKVSLRALFGATAAPGKTKKAEETEDPEYTKRAVARRLKIFWELTTANLPIKLGDLEDRIGEDTVLIGSHLKTLDRLGIVSYEAINYGEYVTAYKLTGKGLQSITSSSFRTSILNKKRILFDILKENQDTWLMSGDLVQKLAQSQNEPESGAKEKYYDRIHTALSEWLREGYIQTKDFHGNFRSTVNLTEEQRTNLVELLDMLERFQNQNPGIVEKGFSFARKLTTGQTAALMAKAKESSPFAKRKTVEEFEDELSIILKSGPLTVSEIAEMVNGQGEQQISYEGVRDRLKKLEKRGRISRSDKNHKSLWSLRKGN